MIIALFLAWIKLRNSLRDKERKSEELIDEKPHNLNEKLKRKTDNC